MNKPPNGLKEVWTVGEYKYTVRVHEANPQYGKTGSIYRVSRQKTGSGIEYMDINGFWHHESTIKPGKLNDNPNYNEAAARDTHISVL